MTAPVYDMAIFCQNMERSRAAVETFGVERHGETSAELGNEYVRQWALIMDEWFRGSPQEMRAVACKERANGLLATVDRHRCDKIASDYDIVENVFRRETQF